jgi:hypothetical protein
MASNNYYYDNSSRPPPSYHSTPDPYAQSTHTPYHSDYPVSGSSTPYGAGANLASSTPKPGQSPFASVFDDNYAASSTNNLQHPGHYPDTAYYGQGGRPMGSEMPGDIPLQDRRDKDGGMNDHVYDAPDAGLVGEGRKKKKKVRVGELGMLGSDKKRIPWVCYVFTVVQIAVFIGEIIKNGKLLMYSSRSGEC